MSFYKIGKHDKIKQIHSQFKAYKTRYIAGGFSKYNFILTVVVVTDSFFAVRLHRHLGGQLEHRTRGGFFFNKMYRLYLNYTQMFVIKNTKHVEHLRLFYVLRRFCDSIKCCHANPMNINE